MLKIVRLTLLNSPEDGPESGRQTQTSLVVVLKCNRTDHFRRHLPLLLITARWISSLLPSLRSC